MKPAQIPSLNTSSVESADDQQLWHRVAEQLKFRIGTAPYNSWIRPIQMLERDGNYIRLAVPTRFIREWVHTHYLDTIRDVWSREAGGPVSVEIAVERQSIPAVPMDNGHADVLTPPAQPTSVISENHTTPESDGLEAFSAPLDPRCTFEHFIIGATNQLAHAAARSVAESDTVVPGSNPLFLYGGVGLGKTHLMQAIAWHIREHSPQRKVVYLSAEKFMYLFIRALRNKDIVSFKEQFRSVDVLMIDDVQFICGKDSTQEEFFHTFNALIDGNRQLVLSGDRSPSDLDGMEERIRSRLGWGLVADINSTTFELRLGILQSKVERLGASIPDKVLEFLARSITSNVRELEGALNKVMAHARLMRRDITLETTQDILRDLLRANTRTVSIDTIQKLVAEHCNIRLADMHSARRARTVARPRQMAMYLSKKLTPHSLPEIGRQFGGRDHTTVMHAVKRMEHLSEEDATIREDIELLTRQLQNG